MQNIYVLLTVLDAFLVAVLIAIRSKSTAPKAPNGINGQRWTRRLKTFFTARIGGNDNMKAVLISIRPGWTRLIVSGQKTIEVRKTRPELETPFKCYIYETKGFERVGNDNLNCIVGGNGRGSVIGEFVCDYIQKLYYDSDICYGIAFPNDYEKKIMKMSCLTFGEMMDYLDGKDGYMWHISELKIYDKPLRLSEFQMACDHKEDCCSCKRWNRKEYACISGISRPPQSWMYVEERT